MMPSGRDVGDDGLGDNASAVAANVPKGAVQPVIEMIRTIAKRG